MRAILTFAAFLLAGPLPGADPVFQIFDLGAAVHTDRSFEIIDRFAVQECSTAPAVCAVQ